MNISEVNIFLQFCHELAMQQKYDFYLKDDTVRTVQKKILNKNVGIVAGLFLEKAPCLLSLLDQPCNHDELAVLLNRYRTDHLNSQLSNIAKKHGIKVSLPPVTEPLEQWIYDNNYTLAYPLCGNIMEKDISVFRKDPERILSFVYLNLMHIYYEKDNKKANFLQPNTDALYRNQFEKSSIYREWGLIPIDSQRILCSFDDPVRIFDKNLNKTIFLQIQRSLAMVLNDLMKNKLITDIAFRSDDFYIYDGENHRSVLLEAMKPGVFFRWI